MFLIVVFCTAGCSIFVLVFGMFSSIACVTIVYHLCRLLSISVFVALLLSRASFVFVYLCFEVLPVGFLKFISWCAWDFYRLSCYGKYYRNVI